MSFKRESLVVGLLALASGVIALPNPEPHYVLHEARGASTNGLWVKGERVAEDAIVPLRIGLTQQNLETGYDRLMAVSHPNSPGYGQHLSAEEVHKIFEPSEEAIRKVKQWLGDSGINDEIVHSENRGWLAVDIPAKDMERLFNTELYEHENVEDGGVRIGCDQYHVPHHIREHIDYITPGVKLSAIVKKRAVTRSANGRPRRYGGPILTTNPPPSYPHPPGYGNLPPELQNCSTSFTPACYRAIYNIPKATRNVSGNSLGLFETGDHYSPADIDLFLAQYATNVPRGTYPLPAYIDGAVGPVAQNSSLNTGESDIDIDIATSLIYPQTVTLYQTDDAPQAALGLQGVLKGFLNTFLDALDGSYCTYSAYGITGDSPGLDAEYPDSRPGGYKGKLQCGVYKPTKVISGSYGQAEYDLPINYQKRQCNEFMKLGLQGTTVFFSSSDYGVASYPGDVSASGCLSSNGKKFNIYNPDYPSNCPYITSVGATQISTNKTIYDPETSLQANLGPGAELFASHGGFANYFPIPAYQKSAVQTYFAKHDPGHPYYVANANGTNIGANGGIYNRGGRGIPDVSANGAKFRAFTNGTNFHYYGTSLAAPLWASIITLINQERAVAGKGPVGFINPVLYANPGVFTDITNGSNPNCNSSGFHAVSGWDPVTGLGTPKYPALLKLFMGLK